MSEDGAMRMEAHELEMRWRSGGRFRLVALTFMRPSKPPKVGGQWPLITAAGYAADDGPQQVLIATEALPDEVYEAYPKDVVVVIPVHPQQAERSTQTAREVVAV